LWGVEGQGSPLMEENGSGLKPEENKGRLENREKVAEEKVAAQRTGKLVGLAGTEKSGENQVGI